MSMYVSIDYYKRFQTSTDSSECTATETTLTCSAGGSGGTSKRACGNISHPSESTTKACRSIAAQLLSGEQCPASVSCALSCMDMM